MEQTSLGSMTPPVAATACRTLVDLAAAVLQPPDIQSAETTARCKHAPADPRRVAASIRGFPREPRTAALGPGLFEDSSNGSLRAGVVLAAETVAPAFAEGGPASTSLGACAESAASTPCRSLVSPTATATNAAGLQAEAPAMRPSRNHVAAGLRRASAKVGPRPATLSSFCLHPDSIRGADDDAARKRRASHAHAGAPADGRAPTVKASEGKRMVAPRGSGRSVWEVLGAARAVRAVPAIALERPVDAAFDAAMPAVAAPVRPRATRASPV
ncbi:MAG: hypothetical protein AAGI51_17385, partial [Pseudomonadota bacterium]